MPTSEQAAKLAAAVETLGEEVHTLHQQIRTQDAVIKRQKWFIRLISGSLAADVLLSFFVIWTGIGVVNNQDEINTLQEDLTAQTELNRTSQCAVMGLFFQSEQNIAANPNRTQQQKDDAAAFFVQMHDIAEQLGCEP